MKDGCGSRSVGTETEPEYLSINSVDTISVPTCSHQYVQTEEHNEAMSKLQSELDQCRSDLSHSQSEFNSQKSKFDPLMVQSCSQKSIIDALKLELDNEKNDLCMGQSLLEVQELLGHVEQGHRQLRNDNRDLKKLVQHRMDELLALRESSRKNMSNLEKQVSNLKESLSHADTLAKTAREENQKLIDEKVQLTQGAEELRSLLESLESMWNSKEAKLRDEIIAAKQQQRCSLCSSGSRYASFNDRGSMHGTAHKYQRSFAPSQPNFASNRPAMSNLVSRRNSTIITLATPSAPQPVNNSTQSNEERTISEKRRKVS